MKTSIKLITLAVLILLGLMLSYDYALKAEYEKGGYKKPFYGYQDMNFKNFNKVIVKAANEISVEIRRSDTFAVKTDLRKHMDIGQLADQLIVNLKPGTPKYIGSGHHVVIFMPYLKEVIVTGFERMEEVAPGRLAPVKKGFDENKTVIRGFRQDDMKLVQAGSSAVILRYCNTARLDAMIGGLPSEHSKLVIDHTDTVGTAVIGVQHRNELSLQDAQISDMKLSLSDSCTVALGGRSLAAIK